MPVEFLSDEQAEVYGMFAEEPTRPELERFFFPDDVDRAGTTRMKDLPTSMVAPLVSEVCNIGLAPVVNPGYEALTRARLVHVEPGVDRCTAPVRILLRMSSGGAPPRRHSWSRQPNSTVTPVSRLSAQHRPSR
ncbi:hypothetical protein [Streptomyces griseoluteus]|uniref:hypothetical protein n=1 Tax=Streptomyces griseoluteus TaxID=29306 RepID=UPI0036A26F68